MTEAGDKGEAVGPETWSVSTGDLHLLAVGIGKTGCHPLQGHVGCGGALGDGLASGGPWTGDVRSTSCVCKDPSSHRVMKWRSQRTRDVRSGKMVCRRFGRSLPLKRVRANNRRRREKKSMAVRNARMACLRLGGGGGPVDHTATKPGQGTRVEP